jgi:galactokinase
MALVRRDEAEKIAERIASNYQRALGMELSWFIAEPCKGAQVFSEP